MTTLRREGDAIEGRKIICIAKKFEKPHRVSTTGEHNVQQTKAEGNPARAVIVKQIEWVK